MYRVLIVDDEEPVLESYEFMLRETADFSLAGKARSGFEALRLIHEQEPDLVFMDINIPGMDGLAVIGEVHKKFPSMIFMLSTAYERFDLAQRAIPLGVFAYLVKPISKKTFRSSLDQARDHLEARSFAGEAAEQLLRKGIWQEMSAETWERYRQRCSLPSDKGLVCLLELEDAEAAVYTEIAEKLAFHYRCFQRMRLNQGLFFISGDIRREALERRLEGIIQERYPGRPGYYGIGGLYQGPELYKSCREALEELGDARSRTGALMRERVRISALRRNMGIAAPEELKKAFTALWHDICALQEFTLSPLAKAKLAALVMFLVDDLYGSYSSRAEEAPPFAAIEEIMRLKDIPEWEVWAERAFDRLLDRAARRGDLPVPLGKALGYIHEHYAEAVQLSSTAEAAQVSPAYLSRLCTEYLNRTFTEYLTEFRIKKAEQLIRESGMNIKEVSYAVGYQDPNYFSKLFRKITGFVPTRYAAETRSELEKIEKGDGSKI
ncbi:MAG: response regulator [Treponema sp.]|jgi:two-component system response regulator YesN|nr:response regulator [Treponema sp.]